MIDIHSHILPGIDDGARDIEDSIAIARAMVAGGIRSVIATPHVRDDYPTTPEAMNGALRRTREALADAGVDLEVLPGAEIALDWLDRLDADRLRALGLGGNPRLLLLEYPYQARPLFLPRECIRLKMAGFVTVIAHPERNPSVQQSPESVRAVVEAGGVVQLTAGSVDGRLGRAAQACSRSLLDLGLAHVIASDAHAPGVRDPGLADAAAAVGGGRLGSWLTHDVPAALLAGDAIPPRPSGPSRSRRRPWHRVLR